MIPAPASKVIATHLTYRSRAEERGKRPAYPSYFLKPPSSLALGGGDIQRPSGCELLAFEGEIALVIGERCTPDDRGAGWSHVGWVTAANDFGVYDFRYADSGSNLRSKGINGFTPYGPNFIPAAEVDPNDLELRTWVNGELRQQARTNEELLFDFDLLVTDLSRLMTLEVGDIILTGTPTGSTVVEPGDVVEVEVVNATMSSGRLRSTIVQATTELRAIGAMPRSTPDDRAAAYGAGEGQGTRAHTDVHEPDPGATRVERRFGAEAAAAMQSVSTATLASQLRKRGLDGCVFDGISTTSTQTKMVGFARTVSYLPMREDLRPERTAGFNAQKRAIESIVPGDILVIGARGVHEAGTIGDILALRAQQRGAAGIITDGAVRDGTAVDALVIPTYSAARSPAVLSRHHLPWSTDVAVACAGTLVEPGDLLVGDDDGVVLLPAGSAAEIAIAAAAQEREESFVLQHVIDGESVDGLYPMNAEWRARYEAADAAHGDEGRDGTSV
jgi:5-oxopent-3-ene-1,2,5-tricarboxylate decarboxylase / 2-hydroxyhepta-2,4-diene-1,7-dioate isomerase